VFFRFGIIPIDAFHSTSRLSSMSVISYENGFVFFSQQTFSQTSSSAGARLTGPFPFPN
jgi:hypothetical protein